MEEKNRKYEIGDNFKEISSIFIFILSLIPCEFLN